MLFTRRPFLPCILSVLLAQANPVCADGTGQTVPDLVAASRKAAKNGDATAALGFARKAVQVDPGNELGYIELATVQAGTNAGLTAIVATLDLGVRSARSPRYLYANRGGFKFVAGDTAGAINDMETYARLSPHDVNAWRALAKYHLARRDFRSAFIAIDRAIVERPVDIQGYEGKCAIAVAAVKPSECQRVFALAQSKCKEVSARLEVLKTHALAQQAALNGDFARAASLFEKVITSDASQPEDSNEILLFITSQGCGPQTLQVGKLIIKAHPHDPNSLAIVGNLALARKETAFAVEAFSKSLELSPSLQSKYHLAMALYASQRYDDALRVTKELLQADYRRKDVLTLVAMCEQQSGEPERAIVALSGVLRFSPNNIAMMEDICDLYLKMNKNDEAMRFVHEHESSAKSVEVADRLALLKARVLYKCGRYRQCLALLNSVLVKSGGDYDALKLRGKIYKDLLLDDLAIADFTSCVVAAKASPEVYQLRADCYRRSGNNALAQADIERSLRIATGNR
jgi:tetratricopeptide (TPR) repeat protein